MHVVLYRFEVKSGLEDQFLQAWNDLTQLIYTHENSRGSRLHKERGQTYIAYAAWPDKNTFKNAGDNLPESAEVVRKAMRKSCSAIEVLHELEVVSDLLARPSHL